MKKMLFVILTITSIQAQCDWNDDGFVDVLDVVSTVNCILSDCWQMDIYGCTDPEAINYNPDATIDDGSCEYETTVTDIDGNAYSTVTIGDQEWMAENLKVTHYRNGDPIPGDLTEDEWTHLVDSETGAYAVCPWTNDDVSLATCAGDCSEIYGNLYNGYAVDDERGICPEGWLVPRDGDWQELVDYLGDNDIAGGPLKATGTVENGDGLWLDPNYGATNETGFSAIPGGERTCYNGAYYTMGTAGRFWSSTEHNSNYNWSRELYCYSSGINRSYYGKGTGYSIRCVRLLD